MSLILKRASLNSFLTITFVLSSLLLGSFIIGPVSLRIYIAYFLLTYLAIYRYRFFVSTELKLYLTFIAVYFFAIILNGEIKELNFLKYFFGRYFVCLIAVYIISTLISTSADIKRVMIFLIVIGIINGIFSVMQFYGNELGTAIPKVLINAQGTEDIFADSSLHESGLNKGVRGIFGLIARNGYFSAVFACLAPYLISISKSHFQRVISTIVSIFLVYVVFLTQQRLVLLLVLVFYVVLIFRQRDSFLVVLVSLIILFIMLNAIDFSIETIKLGRYSDLSDSNRIKLYSLGVEFIKDNFWVGGQRAFASNISGEVGRANSAHNFFLSAFIYSGFFGALFIILLFFKMLFRSIKAILVSKSGNLSDFSIYLGGALAIYLLNSLTHNASLITGDEFIWILYMFIIKADTFAKDHPDSYLNEDSSGN